MCASNTLRALQCTVASTSNACNDAYASSTAAHDYNDDDTRRGAQCNDNVARAWRVGTAANVRARARLCVCDVTCRTAVSSSIPNALRAQLGLEQPLLNESGVGLFGDDGSDGAGDDMYIVQNTQSTAVQ
jgi:hypothetical protein